MLWLDLVLTGATALTTLANAVGGAGASIGGLGGVGNSVGLGSTAAPTVATTMPIFDPATSSKSRLSIHASDSGISSGAIGGIIAGIFIAIFFALLFLRIFRRWRRRTRTTTPPPVEQTQSSATVPVFSPGPSQIQDTGSMPSSPPPVSVQDSPSLHAAVAQAFGHPPPGGPTPPQQEHTHWDVPDSIQSRPAQPS